MRFNGPVLAFLLLGGCTGAIGGAGSGAEGAGGNDPISAGAAPSAGGMDGLAGFGGWGGQGDLGGNGGSSAFGGAPSGPPTGGSSEGGQSSISSSSSSSTGSGTDPTGDWQVGQICAVEVFEPGTSCNHGMNFGTLDPAVVNPCPENCVRNNHVCAWTCRPTCTPNPDPCGPDPCALEGYGQCAAGICWPFTHCNCVNQGLCADCAEAPCP